jgi:signal transduction histidine kinase
MNLWNIAYRPLLSWISLSVLVILVCVLGFLQYRWIGEISQMERKKLQDTLQTSLNEVSRDFNSELASTAASLMPTNAEADRMGREQAYEHRYTQWKNSSPTPRLFSRIAIAWDQNGELTLRMLNLEAGTFETAEWPAAWLPMRDQITARLRRGPGGPPFDIVRSGELTTLFEQPRFSDPGRPPETAPSRSRLGRMPDRPFPGRPFPDREFPGRPFPGRPFPGRPFPSRDRQGAVPKPPEQDWLVLEADPAYIASTVLPELLARHLGSSYQTNYQIDVVKRANPSVAIYKSGSAQRTSEAAASVTLFDVMPGRGGFGRGPRPAPPPPFAQAGDSGRGRWLLSLRLNAGSLETVVARARRGNLAISGAILLLMLITGGALVRFSRQAQRLAQVEMDFVASVSHELRTPLTVIRTAAFNLRGRLANNPIQVERYGNLIREESEKLTAIVEQVLQFASAKSGRLIREREPVSIQGLIEDSLLSTRGILEDTLCRVDTKVEPGLPSVLGDSVALRHALQNLINNAVKYGMDGVKWIGVFACATSGVSGNMIEIRVEDRGPGIPREEQHHIFDAFFRGRRAVRDQIHGTGLGLNLVKKIVEAHGGTVDVQSEPDAGTTFIVKLPALPTEQQHEFTNTLG